MSSPTLSIVTINRNNAAGLFRTLRSLEQARSFPSIECLLIDGASTDDSINLAREFYSAGNWVSEPDEGIYHAMNKGLYRAQGKYVLWLNSGDELLDGAAEVLVEKLSHETTDVCAFAVSICHENNHDLDFVAWPKTGDLPRGNLAHSGVAFRREAVLDLGGYSLAFRIAGDRDLFIRLHRAGYGFVDVNFVVARFYAGGISGSPGCALEHMKLDHGIGRYSSWEYLLLVGKHHLKYTVGLKPFWRRRAGR